MLLLLFSLGWGMAAQAGEWSVGVLAMRGDAATARDWQPLIDSLNGSVGGERFRLQPLDLTQMREAVNRGSVQFVVTNPAQFVQLNSRYHLRWLASLRAANGDRATGNIIGSVILVRRDSGITTPQALMGKTLGAIDPQAFGGYLTGYKALSDAGMRPDRDFHLRFTGFPADALLYLLRERAIQAAIVPVCLLEKMDREGLINPADFRPLLQRPTSVPCVSSTPLYPNWSFAALPGLDNSLVDAVARALLTAPPQSPFQWGAPVSTSEVEALLRAVNQHPEQRRLWLDIKSWLIQHQTAVGLSLAVLALLIVNHIWIALLVRRRGRQLLHAGEQLRRQEQALENARQLNVLGEMASGFAHELNQPLAAIRLYAQGCLIQLRKTDAGHPLLGPLENIDRQAQRGGETIHNLRQWVQPTAEAIDQTRWRPAVVSETAERVWTLLRLTQRYPDLKLFNNVAPSLTLTLPPALLEQLLANLLLNAAQAGANAVWLSAVQSERAIELHLQDNAGGMTTAGLEQAFRPFNTTKAGGMGLGLAICRRLARYGGGEIRLANRPAPDSRNGLCITLHFILNDEENHVANSSGGR
ncbi:sensor histidine kinase [Serratia marcescens]|nr:sensor histidine kinase [Serratia marcescens]MBH2948653.1 sensor histidine kinase [Serratia marcescens]MBH3171874.1 sensor histidine kinase [Serratia marcescens]MBH3261509.1 sensor histidine kinase [Serratia marcescens]MBK5573282.1 sensor histidine kinase [Serratia marcescens]